MTDYANTDWLCIHSVVNHQCKKCWPNLSAPLPPTAEQTSIARFNALADQIRELRETLKNTFYDIDDDFAELNAKLDRIEMRGAHMKGQVERNGILLASLERRIPPRAVAKKKAAPLVGKKGTGRK